MKRVTCEDAELAAYLQRVVGYALTGSTKRRRCFSSSAAAPTANRFSWRYCRDLEHLSSHCADADVYRVQHRATPHGPGRIGRQPAVTASETERGRTWDENKIKTITGGDEVSARFMRGDFFEYTPQYKLLIAGNNKPKLKLTDEAIVAGSTIPFLADPPGGARPNLSQNSRPNIRPSLNGQSMAAWNGSGGDLLPQPSSARQPTNTSGRKTWLATG